VRINSKQQHKNGLGIFTTTMARVRVRVRSGGVSILTSALELLGLVQHVDGKSLVTVKVTVVGADDLRQNTQTQASD